MKIYFIAGEQSGDYIGSKIIASLKILSLSKNIPVEFAGIGGDLIKDQGINSLFPISEINLMGFAEVIPHIRRISTLIDDTVEDIAYHNPDMVITIDSPGFTQRVAKQLKIHLPKIKLVHIVAPSVWAYKPGRAKKYAAIYDYLLTLFPFEPPYFHEVGLPASCMGHPIFEQKFLNDPKSTRGEMDFAKEDKIIAVTPGSRKSEINRHMPIIAGALSRIAETRNIHAIFVQSNEDHVSLISRFLEGARFKYSFSTDRLSSFAIADVALAKSGTNNLEIAASGTAQIIGYKLNILTYLLIKSMIKIKFACIINILANKEIIPEYIQNDFNQDNIVLAISDFLDDPKKIESQIHESAKLLNQIGFNSEGEIPSEIAARKVFELYQELK